MNPEISASVNAADMSEEESQRLFAASTLVDAGDLDGITAWIDENSALLSYPVFNKFGEASLLHYAAKCGTSEMCRMLLERGIDVNYFSPTLELFPYVTPLVNAAREGKMDIVRLFCENGAWIDGHPLCDLTPLAAAIISGHAEVVECLLSYSPDLARMHNRRHKTALDLARTWKRHEIAGLLEKRGAPPAFAEMPLDDCRAPGILACVWEKVGPVSGSAIFSRRHGTHQIDVRMALIDKGDKNKILFTVGAFERAPRREFVISLPFDWPVNTALLEAGGSWAFPLEALFALAAYRLDGNEVDEGCIFAKTDAVWSSLAWPEKIDALVAIDCSFTGAESVTDNDGAADADDTVRLLCLAPATFPKSGFYKGEKLAAWINQRRLLRSSRMSLKMR